MFDDFYRGKKVFITGHTGFKGSWLCAALLQKGAKICGYALKPEEESLFNCLEIGSDIEKSIFADIRDCAKLEKEMRDFVPEIVIHMAAQPLVRESYSDPRYTYETNVIGTLNLFEAALKSGSVKSIVNITTDKCYENLEIDYAYQEGDKLGGYDPYSSSKACAEILTSSYRNSFLRAANIATASVRAGNVIGGGDFSVDRIIPDIFRAIRGEKAVEIRSPNAIRPWQHVLEPIVGYFILAQKLYEQGDEFAKAYNFGPEKDAQVNVEGVVKSFIKHVGQGEYKINADNKIHEAKMLKLNNSLVKKDLKWCPKLSFEDSISWTALWYKEYLSNPNSIKKYTIDQIDNFAKKYD